jgi:cold shock protein
VSITGIFKGFNPQGFGFIKPDTDGDAVFLDIKAVEKAGLTNVTNGQRLIFDVEDRGRGPRAINVRRPPSDGGTSANRMKPEDHAAYVAKRRPGE